MYYVEVRDEHDHLSVVLSSERIEIKAKAAELRKETVGLEKEVIMRLDNIETVEKAWVSKHPLVTLILLLIWTGLMLWAGIAIGHHGCKVVP